MNSVSPTHSQCCRWHPSPGRWLLWSGRSGPYFSTRSSSAPRYGPDGHKNSFSVSTGFKETNSVHWELFISIWKHINQQKQSVRCEWSPVECWKMFKSDFFPQFFIYNSTVQWFKRGRKYSCFKKYYTLNLSPVTQEVWGYFIFIHLRFVFYLLILCILLHSHIIMGWPLFPGSLRSGLCPHRTPSPPTLSGCLSRYWGKRPRETWQTQQE